MFTAAKRAGYCFRDGLSIPSALDARVQAEVANLDGVRTDPRPRMAYLAQESYYKRRGARARLD
jgi:hypothetical protein